MGTELVRTEPAGPEAAQHPASRVATPVRAELRLLRWRFCLSPREGGRKGQDKHDWELPPYSLVHENETCVKTSMCVESKATLVYLLKIKIEIPKTR